jgi:hypothetical protein
LPVQRWIRWGAAIALVAAVGTFVVTGVSLVPVSVALGPCLVDLTSPTTYAPRLSPLATLDIPLSNGSARLCYGRPSARGRPIYGALVPFGEYWRLGANEPTRLYVNRLVSLGGLELPAGRYSLYALPGPGRWTVHVTRSTVHWGNDISASVRSQDVGSFELEPVAIDVPVETLTVHPEQRGDSTMLHFDWATTRVTLPLVQVEGAPHE